MHGLLCTRRRSLLAYAWAPLYMQTKLIIICMGSFIHAGEAYYHMHGLLYTRRWSLLSYAWAPLYTQVSNHFKHLHGLLYTHRHPTILNICIFHWYGFVFCGVPVPQECKKTHFWATVFWYWWDIITEKLYFVPSWGSKVGLTGVKGLRILVRYFKLSKVCKIFLIFGFLGFWDL